MRDEKTLDEFNVRHDRMECAAAVRGWYVVKITTERRQTDKAVSESDTDRAAISKCQGHWYISILNSFI